MRLIDADATFELLKSLGPRDYRREKGTIMDAMKMVASEHYTPTVDAEPIRHGEWIPKLMPSGVSACGINEMTAEVEECSICHKLYSIEDEKRYCPYCGAKMDIERKIQC